MSQSVLPGREQGDFRRLVLSVCGIVCMPRWQYPLMLGIREEEQEEEEERRSHQAHVLHVMRELLHFHPDHHAPHHHAAPFASTSTSGLAESFYAPSHGKPFLGAKNLPVTYSLKTS